MTAIQFTAKRNFVPVATFTPVVDKIDIAFVVTLDDITSVTTDLSGLLATHWLFISGSVANSGWMEVGLASTTTLIGVIFVLTEEAAGPAIRISAFLHGIGQLVDLETEPHVILPSVVAAKFERLSIGGNSETTLHREDKFYDITTDFITAADLPLWEEFFSSVQAGESFTIDLTGTIAVPVDPISVKLEGNFMIQRVGSTQSFTISFKVRVL